MANRIVCKFGGSSVRDAQAIERCLQIIQDTEGAKMMVVSATYDTTNQLEKLADFFLSNFEASKIYLKSILDRHKEIAVQLNINESMEMVFLGLEKEILKLGEQIASKSYLYDHNMDALYSFGERLSSHLVYFYAKELLKDRDVKFIDARKVIITNGDFKKALPLVNDIKEAAYQEILSDDSFKSFYITQGFIGQSQKGETTTLGREGSDFSAVLFAEAIGANRVYIWTDVPGIATCDPRLIEDAQFISEMSYEEASAMAMAGAKVLFPKTLEPAMRSSIDVYVKSTYEPDCTGTRISGSVGEGRKIVGLAFDEKVIENRNYMKISFIGNSLLNENFNPYDLLKESGISLETFEQTQKKVSLLVPKNQFERALKICHDYLLEYC
ncbi:aspartate kinase [Halobacteriovorax sp. GB3]|uniref:aspartate kinase n=1 Tax=Halobacteriovorax sp. GB3 TaxID=2719615 RepID=UPI002361A709|nr:aspartate kinase [Halobacteriovorax sp. GB3]MDD0853709.1 aspartate kinase [Halobacteriovorax sp. GB3]